MPITTPVELLEQYKDDTNHFAHVLEYLFIPALEDAGFDTVSPKSTGSPVIQAEIIKQLSSCELVLCDMSILNPNVFFEFGIRTALDKPVALVVDNKTAPIPFDTSILNFHTYDSSLELWSTKKEKQALANHIHEAYKKSQNRNELWKYFGVTQTGTFRSEDAELGDKIDVIIKQLYALERQKEKFEDNIDMAPLTSTEQKILRMILEGKSNREIAYSLNLSSRTVEIHRSKIMRKLGAKNTVDLVKLAMRVELNE